MDNVSPPNRENCIMTIKTVQISAIRTTFTAIKDMLTDTNMSISPDGIRIVNMDKSHTMLVNLHLEASKFEVFECKKDRILLGINIQHFYTLISTIENNEALTLYIETADYKDGFVEYLGIMFENHEKDTIKIQNFKLIETELDEPDYPEVVFSSVINMPSSMFQKIIKDMSQTPTTKIDIEVVGNNVVFRCFVDYANIKLICNEETCKDEGITFKEKPESSSKIIRGTFSIKYLNYFTKCTSLDKRVELCLENKLPLVAIYVVANLGKLKLALSQL